MAPYDDMSENIKGVSNVETVSVEQREKYSVVLIRRLYDTGDENGDEVITQKLNQEYCLVLYTLKPGDTISV